MKALKARSLLNAEIISGRMIPHCLNSSLEIYILDKYMKILLLLFIYTSQYFKIKSSLGHLHLCKFHLLLMTVLFMTLFLEDTVYLYLTV